MSAGLGWRRLAGSACPGAGTLMVFVGGDDLAHQRMSDHVLAGEEGERYALDRTQDLDRLTQTAVALAEFARKVAGADGITDPPHMTQIVAEMPLRSVADRLGASLGLTPELLVGVH